MRERVCCHGRPPRAWCEHCADWCHLHDDRFLDMEGRERIGDRFYGTGQPEAQRRPSLLSGPWDD